MTNNLGTLLLVALGTSAAGGSDENVLNYVRGVMAHTEAWDIEGVPVFDYFYATGNNIQLGYRNKTGIYKIVSDRHTHSHDLVCTFFYGSAGNRKCSRYDLLTST